MQAFQNAAMAPAIRAGLGKHATVIVFSVLGLAEVAKLLVAARNGVHQAGPVQRLNVKDEQQLLLNEVLPLTPVQLWALIYDLAFIQRFYAKMGYREISISDWQQAGEYAYSKAAHYITSVKKNVLGPSEAYAEEIYECQGRDHNGFEVRVFAYTRKVPYGGSFHVELVWTARSVSEESTRLQVIGHFVTEKRMLGVGSIIRKATFEGLQETYKLYKQHLWEAMDLGKPRGSEDWPSDANGHGPQECKASTKNALEVPVENKVVLSWTRLICVLLIIVSVSTLARMDMYRELRALCTSWRAAGYLRKGGTHQMH